MLARCMISTALVWTGCSFEGNSADGGAVTVQGQVVDFQTGAAVDATDVTVSGLIPPPPVDHQGASFTIAGVPEKTRRSRSSPPRRCTARPTARSS